MTVHASSSGGGLMDGREEGMVKGNKFLVSVNLLLVHAVLIPSQILYNFPICKSPYFTC